MQFGSIIMLVTRLFYTLVFVNFIDVFKLVTSTATQNDIFQLQSQMQILISQSQADRNRMEMIVRDSLDKDTEIQQLRNEIRNLKTEMDSMKTKAEISYSKGNRAKNEQLTVKWLANSVTEIRAEIAEMIRSLNSSTELQQRQTFSTDIAMLQNDIVSLRHDIESLKGDMAKNNAKSSVIFQDIEVLKQLNSATSNKLTNFTAQINGVLNEWARSVKKLQKHERRVFKKMIVANENPLEMKVLTLPQEIGFEPRKRKRHFRPFEDESSLHEAIARSLRNDLNKQKNLLSATSIVNETDEYSNYSKTNSALLNLEKRISRLEVFSSEMNVRFKEQEKLHSSMLELLESVENIEAKVDSVTPDLKKEISKLEFTFSQITSNATILLEKQESQAKMIKLITENLSALEAKVENNRNTMVLMNGNENEILSKYDSSMFACNVLMALLKKNLSSNVEDNNEMETSTQAINEMLQGLQFLNYQYKALRQQLPKDCADVDGSSGIHLISPDGGTPVLVFCEISNLPDSSSYTVIQRRINGKVNFNRSWEEYATGFGNLLSEFWLGNEIIHRLTKKEDMIARIEFEGIDGKLWYAQYDKFVVASREEKFRLTLAEFSGNATNALEYQNHMEFSTSDSDHDISNTNCAASYEGGWWFSHCQHTNLNGKYNVGLTWFDSISNEWIDISSSKIMLTKHKR